MNQELPGRTPVVDHSMEGRPADDHSQVFDPPSNGAGAGRRVMAALNRLLNVPESAPLAALVTLVLVIGLTHSRFFSGPVLVANFRSASLVAIIAYGMVFLLAMGEIDLSVGGTYGIAFWVAAKLANFGHVNPYLAAAIAIGVGVGLGAVNGVLANVVKAPVIIITLGTYSLYAGVVAVISGGSTIGQNLPLQSSFFTKVGGTWLGLPVAGWVALALMILLTVVLTRSRLGTMIRSAGSNRNAAAFSGVPIDRLRLYSLMLTGGLAALSGVLSLAYLQGADSSIGTGFELQVIAAAIIGGTAVTGGTGSVPGGLIGALIVAAINSGLVFFNVNPLWSNVVTGTVILIAVGSAAILTRHRVAKLDNAPL
jgi:ribose transport system permease protein